MAIEAPRFSSSKRPSVSAIEIEPFCLKPVAWPVSFSSPSNRLGGVFGEFGQIARGAQLADKACRMPGGAGGQLLPLQHHNIGDADFGQVVGNRTVPTMPPPMMTTSARAGSGFGHWREFQIGLQLYRSLANPGLKGQKRQ